MHDTIITFSACEELGSELFQNQFRQWPASYSKILYLLNRCSSVLSYYGFSCNPEAVLCPAVSAALPVVCADSMSALYAAVPRALMRTVFDAQCAASDPDHFLWRITIPLRPTYSFDLII